MERFMKEMESVMKPSNVPHADGDDDEELSSDMDFGKFVL